MSGAVDPKSDERGAEGSRAPASTARAQRQGTRRRSIRVARASRAERIGALVRAKELEQHSERPRLRADCENVPRPCPYVACRHHLYLDVSPSTGTIKLNFPELEVWELAESCALDVADAGGLAPERTSRLLNVTRERVRQIEARALERLANFADLNSFCDAPSTARSGPALRARSAERAQLRVK